ncbi:1-(5-phosphoribosyl)-5-((5-phosphoribosylamino)methylideneamino) imidazole-4-carboxamide isomerase [Isosphaera pallida ATCC 43644]|uniref:1-(5-phosphoribosyl)-5-[(5-phosphoribosylamino)methylideneamino] imidazole-4-carboxamide isomerase n=1 Tax=Isosphaera pallida (strain ATCC 43644 / DSM 9630 / IS1B) TaxID=575540 RepID=E8R234_ISOPI|nr:1-(5-phosphoribosyl)-5-[(5-phosphoribosylamino)methylideneamino]imidazole-4-carboxamide isomerase [Isosphaera pallida]ADV62466.1 1-(5-phosphoribosyl)-5-((5-phosphoribosylamino)methylideneamino) imidazole-4-carboxamide isomerase [Isosphaera pallida ATCC 43644]
MRILPAIDLKGGRVVRLRQGDYGRETVYGDDPVAWASHWRDEGAQELHLVDLDGAKDGHPVNFAAVRAILERVGLPCQLGGGVRDAATVASWLEAGVARVIVGTLALTQPELVRDLIAAHPGRVVLGIDARDGKVAARGWLDLSDVTARDLAARFEDLPLAAIVFTDIARDGTLEGPNFETTFDLARGTRHPVIASGGVSSLEDLRRLAQAEVQVAGCIVGRALYDGCFTLAQALEAARTGS